MRPRPRQLGSHASLRRSHKVERQWREGSRRTLRDFMQGWQGFAMRRAVAVILLLALRTSSSALGNGPATESDVTQRAELAFDTVPASEAVDSGTAGASNQANSTKPAGKTAAGTPPRPFANTPPVFVFPRLGLYPVFPGGEGYYSAEDFLLGNYRPKPPPFPWGRISLKPFPFYDADFRYLDDPENTYHMWSDFLKRRRIGDDWHFSSGGEFRDRYMNEVDSRLTNTLNRYEQLRTMVYGSLWYRDDIGVFAQYLDAQSFGNDLNPVIIDVNHSDMVDLFLDVKIMEWEDRPVYVRGGRQELTLGSQRIVSNLEWANTLRTFQGVRGFRNGEKWDTTAFWLQPIIPDPVHFDSPDWRQHFSGFWATYRPKPGQFWDLYALNLEDTRQTFVGRDGALGGSNITTLGTRYVGDIDNELLYDAELMCQVGRHSNQNLLAAATTTGMGYNFKDKTATPQIWLYYDYASGDADPGSGNTFSTFNQLYPFGHYYLGYLDLVARQNIQDLNVQFVAFPTKWIYFLAQYHNFHLANAKSPLFNAAGVPSRVDPTGQAGTYVGNEIDFVVNFHLTAHQDILIGYSKLFAGPFLQRTGPNVSPDLFYLQHQLRW